MSKIHLLPCPCGKQIPVSPQQAGQNVECTCGITLDIPKLRDMRQLPLDTSVGSLKASGSKWSFGRGLAFAVGMVLAVLSGGATAYFHSLTSQLNVPTAEAQQQALVEQIDGAQPTEIWALWTKLRDHALDERPGSQRAEAENLLHNFTVARNVALASVVAGLLLSAAAYSAMGRLLASPGTSRT